MRPDVAAAFDRMAAAARRDGLALSITSAFRSDAEQARLFAANPNPKWVAPPGTSLHRYATELDLGPPGAYAWLAANARRFGFIHRYAWEPWHYGFGANPRDREHPAQYERGSWEPPGGDHGRIAPRAAELRAAPLPRPDRARGAALERADGAARRPALRRVGLQPVRARARRARRASPSSCPAPRARTGSTDPFDPDRGDRRAGPPDVRPAAALRRQGRRWRWPPTTRAPGRWSATAACRRTPRRAPTWRSILGLLGGAGALAGGSAWEVRLVG